MAPSKRNRNAANVQTTCIVNPFIYMNLVQVPEVDDTVHSNGSSTIPESQL